MYTVEVFNRLAGCNPGMEAMLLTLISVHHDRFAAAAAAVAFF